MVEFFIVLLISIFLFGISYAFYTDVKKHTFYLFITAIQIFYLFNTPVRNFIINDFYAVNVNVKDFYGFGFSMLALHVILFNIFYFLSKRKNSFKTKNANNIKKINKKNIFIIFFILFTLVFFNSLADGVNLIDIIQGKHDSPTLGLQGASYYIQNFADSMITLIVAAYIFKIPFRHKMIMTILGFVLFLILGFRYRILLTVFAIALYFIHKKGIRLRSFFTYLSIFTVFFYSLMCLTHNRRYIFMQQFDKVSYNPYDFDYDVVFDQAKGSLIDFAMYKGLSEGTIQSDYGQTMFLYVFVKMTPASLFPGGVKPYPPPMLTAIDKSLNASRDIGEAVTMLGASYYAFSYFGLIILSVFFGFYIKRIEPDYITDLKFLKNVMILMAIFQLYTRGYFPQFIDHLVYMLFPLLFITWKFKKISNLKAKTIKN